MGESVTPNIGAAYEITIFNVDGTVKQVIRDEAKCFVMNFLRMIKNWCYNAQYVYQQSTVTSTPFRKIDGTLPNSYGISPPSDSYSYGSFLANGAIGDLTKGIVVGTDGTTVTYDDYKLGTMIAHGTGAGQLSYDSNTFPPLSPVGTVSTLTITRMVNNASGGSVTINEMGLYATGQITIMLLRDVVSPAVVLGDGEAALIVYKLIFNG